MSPLLMSKMRDSGPRAVSQRENGSWVTWIASPVQREYPEPWNNVINNVTPSCKLWMPNTPEIIEQDYQVSLPVCTVQWSVCGLTLTRTFPVYFETMIMWQLVMGDTGSGNPREQTRHDDVTGHTRSGQAEDRIWKQAMEMSVPGKIFQCKWDFFKHWIELWTNIYSCKF